MIKPKILLISSNSSPRGGGERYLVYLTQGLRELGCEVHVLLSDVEYMNGWALAIFSEGGIVYRLPLKSLKDRRIRFIDSVLDKSQIKKITKFCLEISPDAILVNQQYDEDGLDYLMGAINAKIAPVSGVIHMPMIRNKKNNFFGWFRGKLLLNFFRKYSYRLILVSEGAQIEFESYYDAPRPTYVVNNAVPCELPQSLDRSRSIFNSYIPVIGFIGQFVWQKNLECLVYAWLDTRDRGLESHLLLVGDGPERLNLEKILWQNAPPGSWLITGWEKSTQEYLCEMDIFVMTSHFEGMPLSLLEAASLGIPAVVAPFNGASDVSRRAGWVKVASGNSIGEIATLMESVLLELPALKALAVAGLGGFRSYFSLKRMASEVLAVHGLKAD